jgi:hypothetical protein
VADQNMPARDESGSPDLDDLVEALYFRARDHGSTGTQPTGIACEAAHAALAALRSAIRVLVAGAGIGPALVRALATPAAHALSLEVDADRDQLLELVAAEAGATAPLTVGEADRDPSTRALTTASGQAAAPTGTP